MSSAKTSKGCRSVFIAIALALFGQLCVATPRALAQDPVPLINQPFVSDATAPGLSLSSWPAAAQSSDHGQWRCRKAGPYPCARTDLNVQQESTPAGWSWDPVVNAVQNDPDFGSPIVRVTDENTLISPTCFNRPSSSNSSLHGSASPEVNVFSSDDKWLRVSDTWGSDWLMSFNPKTLHAGCAPVASTNTGALPWSNGIFGRSGVDAGKYFGIQSHYILSRYDVTQHSNSNNVPIAIADLSQCPGLAFLRNLPNKSMGWSPTLSLSGDEAGFYTPWGQYRTRAG
jgi:hypothetical protein